MPFKAGQTVVFQGHAPSTAFTAIVAFGQVRRLRQGRANRAAPALVAELAEGEVFGETSIVEKSIAGATVKASGSDLLVLMIPQESFRHVLQQDEGFAVRVNTLIAGRRPVPPRLPADAARLGPFKRTSPGRLHRLRWTCPRRRPSRLFLDGGEGPKAAIKPSRERPRRT